jgi:hypothetical protein
MGVLYDIYCIPKEPFSVQWSTIVDKLIGDGFVRPPFWAGDSLRTSVTTSFLRTPELAYIEARVGGEPGSPRELGSLDEALGHIAREDAAMLVVEVLASALRREPQNFHPMSSHLGLYRFRAGRTLTIGEPDPTWQGGGGEARWHGEVFELLWIHGKNAPLAEDFEGSALHLALGKLWPGCLVFGDERL